MDLLETLTLDCEVHNASIVAQNATTIRFAVSIFKIF